jgi:transposase InsO family protein
MLLDLKPRIGRIFNAEKTFEMIYQDAPMQHRLTHAARRLKIEPYLPGGLLEGQRPKNHSTRRWLRAFEANEQKGLCGDMALFPGFYRCGRSPVPLAPEIEAEFLALTKQHYLTPKHCSIAWIWRLLVGKFGESKLPDKKTIYRRVGALDPHKRAWKRGGKRIALATQPIFGDSPVWGSPHGLRSFQRAHIDSTPVDLRLESEDPHYLAKMVDAFDGRILAKVLTAESPSELTIRALLLECVSLHGALPAEITYDFGPEHRTVWIEESLAGLGIILDTRPKSDPRKGGPVESAFSALCKKLIHNLEGNTQLMKRARMITKACNPDQFAIWTSADLRQLLDDYVALSNSLPRSGKPAPDDIAAASYEKYGVPPRNMPTVADLEVLLLPFVEGETRTVSKRGTVKCQDKIYGIRGMRNDLRRYAGKDLKVRCVPNDPGTVYVFPESPRRAIRCEALTTTGPAQDILDRALAIEQERAAIVVASGETPRSPLEREAAFAVATVQKEVELKARKARKVRAAKQGRPISASCDSKSESDANIPTIHVN